MRIRSSAFSLPTALALLAFPVSASGQMVVYDPSNESQNVLQAARMLQQINNQIAMLQNQTRMLINQARNLASLPYSTLQTIDGSLARTQQLFKQAERLGYEIKPIEDAFARRYPGHSSSANSANDMQFAARARWEDSLAAHQDALRVQASVVQELETTRTQLSGLVSSSQ